MDLNLSLTILAFILITALATTVIILKNHLAKLNHQQAGTEIDQQPIYLHQFQYIANFLPDAIVILNRNNQIEWSNNSADNLLKINLQQHKGQLINNLLQQPDFTAALDNIDKQIINIEVALPHTADITINIRVIDYKKNSSGTHNRHSENVTARILIAQNISRLTKATQARQDFVANVSHELKTPLTVLRGYLEVLEDDPKLATKFKNPLRSMMLQSMRMQNIVNDLLYLSKLEENNSAANHIPINMHKILDHIVEAAKTINNDKTHHFEININSSVDLNGNTTEIYSAFSNLVFNAVHYTPDKGIIQLYWQQDKQNKYFSVEDNGAGIAPKHIERLTERFYRANLDRSREKGGTGLGLAIVKHVLNRHKATLHITSTLGKGSLFQCNFPRSQK